MVLDFFMLLFMNYLSHSLLSLLGIKFFLSQTAQMQNALKASGLTPYRLIQLYTMLLDSPAQLCC